MIAHREATTVQGEATIVQREATTVQGEATIVQREATAKEEKVSHGGET
jgi:hypothetical protein